MPLYEYQCTECSDRFENIQKFSDPLLKVCKKCGGSLEQLISSPAIQFKGSGWYITDYAKKGGSAAASGGNDEGGKPSDHSGGDGTSPSSSNAPGNTASDGADSSKKSKKPSKESSKK